MDCLKNYNRLIDESRLFFFTGEPTNELGVSQDSVRPNDGGLLSTVGDNTFGSLSIGWSTVLLL